MGHTFSRLLYHVVFRTKGGRTPLPPRLRAPIEAYMHGIAKNKGARMVEVKALGDHVHLLLQIKPSSAPSDIVGAIKSNSSRWVHEEDPKLRSFAWQDGFGVFTVSPSVAPKVAAYIENQEEHHRKRSFAEEYRLLLERHGIDYDPEHCLD